MDFRDPRAAAHARLRSAERALARDLERLRDLEPLSAAELVPEDISEDASLEELMAAASEVEARLDAARERLALLLPPEPEPDSEADVFSSGLEALELIAERRGRADAPAPEGLDPAPSDIVPLVPGDGIEFSVERLSEIKPEELWPGESPPPYSLQDHPSFEAQRVTETVSLGQRVGTGAAVGAPIAVILGVATMSLWPAAVAVVVGAGVGFMTLPEVIYRCSACGGRIERLDYRCPHCRSELRS